MNRFQQRWHKMTRWEYWTPQQLYIPLTPIWLYLAMRGRQLMFYTGANPTMKHGGMSMVPKNEIYDLIPEEYIPNTILVNPKMGIDAIMQKTKQKGIDFPMVAKPNIGIKGLGVKFIHQLSDLESYLDMTDDDFLIQSKIPYSNEVGIFYCRYPDQKAGFCTGMVKKEFLSVTGDGKSTILQLIEAYPRALFQMKAIQKLHNEDVLKRILSAGERFELIPFGSHTRGAKFIDISEHLTEALCDKINEISVQTDGFYYGRLDVMYDNWEDLLQGKKLTVIEINGAQAEPTHMYDPKHSLFYAWGQIYKHYSIMERINRQNRSKLKNRPTILECFMELRANYKVEKGLRKITGV